MSDFTKKFPAATASQVHLRLLATTDLHVHVLPYDYYADAPLASVGLAQTASLIDKARAEAANTFLFDNGDFLQGNPMGDYIAYERGMPPGTLHPAISAMNTLGYDAATLGNHEFNFGLDFLLSSIAGAGFPIVTANAITSLGQSAGDDQTLLPAHVVLDRVVTDGAGNAHPLRIGVIGFLPPQTVMWDRRHLDGLMWTRDIVETARNRVPELRALGCDLVVALAHTGIGPAGWTPGMENAATPLAAVDGIDALFTGHTHLVFPPTGNEPDPESDPPADPAVDPVAGTLHGKPTVMAGLWGSHLGVIDLLLDHDGRSWSVTAHRVEARPIARRDSLGTVHALVPSAPRVVASVSSDHDDTLAFIRRPVGRTLAPLTSYFSLLANDPSLQVVMDAQSWHVSRQIAGTPLAGLPLLSAAAPLKTGGRSGPDFYTDIPAGELAMRHVADLYQFPNTIRAVLVSGAELSDWLERSAGVFADLSPDRPDQPLLCAEFARYNFDVISGVTYRIDLSQPSKFGPRGALVAPSATRVRDLRWQGQPVGPADRFLIATNNYRADGGGNFAGAQGRSVVYASQATNRDILLRYIAALGTLRPRASETWGFSPLPGVSAIFETGPRALGHIPDIPGLSLAPAGNSPDGSLRLRVTFQAAVS